MSAQKQAVVVIHGMGEQRPLETIRSFVEAAWTRDKNLVSARGKLNPNTGEKREGDRNFHWIKPDPHAGSHELRRLTTESDDKGRRTDFFEFYWANLTNDNTWSHVLLWIFGLLFRSPRQVPKAVRSVWCLLWIISLTSISIATLGFLNESIEGSSRYAPVLFGLLSVAGSFFGTYILINRFGDVARFVEARPSNIAALEAIREKGVSLLRQLSESGKYDRIVVVSHSLGTIIAYDVLSTLFGEYNKKFLTSKNLQHSQPKRAELEDLVSKSFNAELGEEQLDVSEYQKLQNQVLKEAQELGSPWIISDFITLGSPLTHAEFLMAQDKADLDELQSVRLMPTCPPQLEFDERLKNQDHQPFRFTYSPQKSGTAEPQKSRCPHHAALFAYTRWTNIYSPSHRVILGDLISGPLGKAFGLKTRAGGYTSGIQDIAVLPRLAENSCTPHSDHKQVRFSHTHYWDLTRKSERTMVGVPFHIQTLREVLDLARLKDEKET